MRVAMVGVCTSHAAWRLWCGAALLLVSAFVANSLHAAQYERLGFGQFTHKAWTVSDGAPLNIQSIAQTPDGYLWLGSAQGLYRFDGVTFERIAGPAGSPMERAGVTALHVTRSGQLWVGFSQYGGIGRVRGGRLTDMGLPDPDENITHIAETADGAIWPVWAGYGARIQRLFKGRWERMANRMELPKDVGVVGLCGTSDGTLWASLERNPYPKPVENLIVYLPPGGQRFRQSQYRVHERPGFAIDPNEKLWIHTRSQLRALGDRFGKPLVRDHPFPRVPCPDIAFTFDADGGIWRVQRDSISHVSAVAGQPYDLKRRVVFGRTDGLTSASVNVVFSDREGNIWVGTEQGLDQFRKARVLMDPTPLSHIAGGTRVASSTDGKIYVAGKRLFEVAPFGLLRPILGDREPSADCGSSDTGLWVFYDSKLVKYHDGQSTAFAGPSGDGLANVCAEDRLRRLWLTRDDGRLGWRDASGFHVTNMRPEWWDLVITPKGDLAFKTVNDLVEIRGDRTVVTRLGGYHVGALSMIRAGTHDIFLSGANGLLRVRDDHVARLDGQRYPWVTRLREIVQTPAGETWMFRHDGVSRVSTAALDRAFDNPRASLERTVLDIEDGIESAVAPYTEVGVHAAVGGDGRVWFLNALGASVIDPARLSTNRLAPPVAIRALVTGGRTYIDPGKLTLPPGTRSLDIAYTALSLAVPNRVKFRYRLEGVDDDWVDPGTRRTASYSNLGAGDYRFNVIAANNDGVWNKTGATLDFEIRPTFIQSWPFKLLCALIVLALLWLAYSVRLRAMADRMRRGMAERIAERERIARELHDTLLQAVQSLTLRFQLVVDDLSIRGPPRLALEAAIDRADQVIAEARDRVLELRSPQERNDVEQVMTDIVAQQGFDPAVAVSIESVGSPHALDPLALDEIARIAGEAIFNIRRHARATRIVIELRHHANLVLSFADNGVGIDPAVVEQGSRDGHFGLPGMRERARKLDGDLVVRRIAQGGTQVMLTVPGRIAYKPRKVRWNLRWWRS